MKFFIFLIATASAFTTATDLAACRACLQEGQQVCWDWRLNWQGAGGNWGRSYCCQPGDTICAARSVCSDQVSPASQDFSCPVSMDQCPTGSQAELVLGDGLASARKEFAWNQTTGTPLCKFRVRIDLRGFRGAVVGLRVSLNNTEARVHQIQSNFSGEAVTSQDV